MTNANESYSQWVRRVSRSSAADSAEPLRLFDSSVGEPLDLIRALIEEAFGNPITSRYQSVFSGGNPFIVSSLSKRYAVDESSIICTTGASSGLSLICRTFLASGDHVLIESPGLDLFTEFASATGVEVEYFQRTGATFQIEPADIARRVKSSTRLLVLSNLHNPSGMLLRDEALTPLARLAEQRDFVVVVDEVYGDYADVIARPTVALQLSPKFISVNSLSKFYGLGTLRCGWIAGDTRLIEPIRALNDRQEFGNSKLSHAVSALVLEQPAPFDEFVRAAIAETRPVFEEHFSRWKDDGLVTGALPEFGCIAFPRLIRIDDTLEFSTWLADHYGVIVAPGEFFGAPGHVRIGFAREPERLDYALTRLEQGIRDYVATSRPSAARDPNESAPTVRAK